LYLARAHREATVRICEAMTRAGGYILHLDATHAGNAPALMTGLDGLSKIVLANVKIPTEHTEHIVPFLKEIKEAYGTPIACVHDMGVGICKGVSDRRSRDRREGSRCERKSLVRKNRGCVRRVIKHPGRFR